MSSFTMKERTIILSTDVPTKRGSNVLLIPNHQDLKLLTL